MQLPSLKGIGIMVSNAENEASKLANAVKDFFGKEVFSKISEVYNSVAGGLQNKANEVGQQLQTQLKIPSIANPNNPISKLAQPYIENLQNPQRAVKNVAESISNPQKAPKFLSMIAQGTGPGMMELGGEGNIVKNIIPEVPVKSAEIDPVQTMINALKEAEPIRGQQEQIYSEARSAKLGKAMAIGKTAPGESGFYQQLGALKGEMPKVQYESIRDALGKTPQERQTLIDTLFNKINEEPTLQGFDNITAKGGLKKALEGIVPTENELVLLEKVFGQDFTKTLMDKLPFWQKAKDLAYNVANIPRSLMASFDLSAPLRQGAFLIGRQNNSFRHSEICLNNL
jgi:hypothetical protein